MTTIIAQNEQSLGVLEYGIRNMENGGELSIFLIPYSLFHQSSLGGLK